MGLQRMSHVVLLWDHSISYWLCS